VDNGLSAHSNREYRRGQSGRFTETETRLLTGISRHKCLKMPAVIRVYNIGP
jgi:hypothetical protein